MSQQLLNAIKFADSNFKGQCRINSNNFGDPLTFNLAPPSHQNITMPNSLIYDQLPAKTDDIPIRLSCTNCV